MTNEGGGIVSGETHPGHLAPQSCLCSPHSPACCAKPHAVFVRFSKAKDTQLNVNFLPTPGLSELGCATAQTCRKRSTYTPYLGHTYTKR